VTQLLTHLRNRGLSLEFILFEDWRIRRTLEFRPPACDDPTQKEKLAPLLTLTY